MRLLKLRTKNPSATASTIWEIPAIPEMEASAPLAGTMPKTYIIPLIISIISKERTEGGLNKRAAFDALLFNILLVFP